MKKFELTTFERAALANLLHNAKDIYEISKGEDDLAEFGEDSLMLLKSILMKLEGDE